MSTPSLIAAAALALALGLYANWANAQDHIVIYPSFTALQTKPGTATLAPVAFVIEGRVIDRKDDDSSAPKPTDGKRNNLRRSVGLMINKERKHYPVTVRLGTRAWTTETDQEGYFRIEVSADIELAHGWHEVEAMTNETSAKGQLLVVPPVNVHGVISDIDDTVMVTEVNSKRRMLANTFLRNPLQRQAVEGITQFYADLGRTNPLADSAPIVYLSASPRQLHTSIGAFLEHNRFPAGVLVTKKVTDDATGEPISDQVAYKKKKIEEILIRLPHVSFTLIGDDGERDPEIYAEIRERFPDRIAAIWIRKVNPDPNRKQLPNQGRLDDELKKYRSQSEAAQ